MFQRLLNLPEDVRKKYDVSSLRYIIHGAAPCPPEVKKAMIDWVGPIINEYYAGSEGGAGFVVSLRGVADQARHGRQAARPRRALRILDDDGNEVTQGELRHALLPRLADRAVRVLQGPGQDRRGAPRRLLHAGRRRLPRRGRLPLPHRPHGRVHHLRRGQHLPPGDRQRADQASGGRGQLHHRRAQRRVGRGGEVGGHPATRATPARDELARDIIAFARERLAGFKVPRSVEFVDELPRSPAGKIQRKKVRDALLGRARRQI